MGYINRLMERFFYSIWRTRGAETGSEILLDGVAGYYKFGWRGQRAGHEPYRIGQYDVFSTNNMTDDSQIVQCSVSRIQIYLHFFGTTGMRRAGTDRHRKIFDFRAPSMRDIGGCGPTPK